MRPLLKYLPVLLTLILPLSLLGWLGSREFSRLEERSVTLLQAEARRFLENAEVEVRDDIQRDVKTWLDNPDLEVFFSDPNQSIVEVSSRLGTEIGANILQAFVVDEKFALVAPKPARVPTPSAPLHRFPESRDGEDLELLRADILFNYGDTQGAIQCYRDYLARHDDKRGWAEGRMWAAFHLAGLFDESRIGIDDASDMYFRAMTEADEICRTEPTEAAAQVILLSEFRQTQLSGERLAFSPQQTLKLLRGVCAGTQDYIEFLADDLLDDLVYRMATSFPEEAPNAPTKPAEHDLVGFVKDRDAALALNEVRKAGREFANDYDNHARLLLQGLQGSERLQSQGTLFHSLTTKRGARLLALRPARREETDRYDGDAAWVGLVLDLKALLSRSLSSSTSGPGNVALAVNDPNGVALLVNQMPAIESTSIRFPPVRSELADLEFVAIPLTDPMAMQSTARNQAYIGLILVIVAAVGAFMLIRSVNRETELARMKVMLLSRVSHELKTPLAVIKMYGETLGLGRTKDQAQVSRFAGIISGEADRLTSMVERILDFSKMEAGTFTYDKERVDLGDFVEAVTLEYEPHVEAQGMELRHHIDPDITADLDPRGLASSVVNLLENALKYTPKDAVEKVVEVNLEKKGANAVLEVRDRGVGIPDSERTKVFDDFYRAGNAGEVRGAGLGLSLVAHFARAHGGKAEALSHRGGGTIMRLTLPLADETENAETTA